MARDRSNPRATGHCLHNSSPLVAITRWTMTRKCFLCSVRHARREYCRMGRQARLRFRSSGNRYLNAVQREKDSFLGWARERHSGNGWRAMDSLQLATFPTPPFPDFVSGHSTYSAAAASILALWAGSDRFGDSVSIPAGSSKIEPGITPTQTITLKRDTFTDAADEAGMSLRYGGIHFARADIAGRRLGRLVAERAWKQAQAAKLRLLEPVAPIVQPDSNSF
jgi:hypothetical protein